MDHYCVSITVESVLNYVLLWVGMSIVSGVFAKLLVPGKNPRGTLATFFIGFFGVIGSALLLKYIYFKLWEIEAFNPVQPTTLIVGIILSAVGLYLYRGITGSLTKKKE